MLTGEAVVWYMNGTQFVAAVSMGTLDPAWKVAAPVDLNGNGNNFLWYLDGTQLLRADYIGTIDLGWDLLHAADYNRDGRPDLVFRERASGVAIVEYMAGSAYVGGDVLYALDPLWQEGPVGESLQKLAIATHGPPVARALPPRFALAALAKHPGVRLPALNRLAHPIAPMPVLKRPAPGSVAPGPLPTPPGKRLEKALVVDNFALYDIYSDHLNTPRLITRPSDGKIVWRWDNADPFGANAAEDNPSGLGPFVFNQRFPGQYYGAETGTHYNYFRDYDPSIGGYVESDPIGLYGGLNTFGYVKSRPLMWRDPNGLESVPMGGGGAALPGWLGDAIGGVGRLCTAPVAMLIFATTGSNRGDGCSDDPSHKRDECKAKACDDEWRQARQTCRDPDL